MARQTTDPLRRDTPASEVPLQSPMPRSPILDREEPELRDERDVPDDADSQPDAAGRRA